MLLKIRRAAIYVFVNVYQVFRVFCYRYFYSDNSPQLKNVKLNQPVRFCGKGSIELDSCEIGVYRSPFFLDSSSYVEARYPAACVKIGAQTHINNAVSIIACEGSIEIGERCLIGSGVTIVNSNFHSLDVNSRKKGRPTSLDVRIGDDVFIGSNAIILRGVSIGDGAVIGAGVAVAKSVKSGEIIRC